MNLEDLGGGKLPSKDKKINFQYDDYWKAIEIISKDIKDNYDLTKNDIGILGMARGALPMLVSLSHELGIRKVSSIQLQMSNSDNCHDYGDVRIINECINDEYKNFILFEDIIYKGKTTNAAIDILNQKNKNVLAVYSLIIDENFKNIEIKNNNTKIKYVYEISANDWVYFLWEKNLNRGE